jgi:ribosomal protein S18 acetylase RimI-like enzyme
MPRMELRLARHTDRLDDLVRFYRDGIGLTEIGGFRDHDGYDGVFLAVPGTGAHLELTTGGGSDAPVPHPESLLVLYLGDDASVGTVAARLGVDPIAPANPFWAEHGLTFPDPDGFHVVLVPERWTGEGPSRRVEIDWYTGARSELRSLFELAEDSPERLRTSIDEGQVLVATEAGQILGYLQLVDSHRPGEAELKSMAVGEHRQRQGIGRALVAAAVAQCRAAGLRTMLVATASADTGNLRFYQRLGFRMLSIQRDAFTAADRYPAGLVIDGIPLLDRVWLTLGVQAAGPERG